MTTPTIGPERPADRDAIDDLLRAAFGGQDEAALVKALRADGDLACALVARRAVAVVGFIAFEPIIVEPDPGFATWALAPVAVLPEHQSVGIGSVLISAGLDRAAAAGIGFVAVLGDPANYGRFGFRADRAAGLAVPWSGRHFMGLSIGNNPPPAGGARYPRAFGPRTSAVRRRRSRVGGALR